LYSYVQSVWRVNHEMTSKSNKWLDTDWQSDTDDVKKKSFVVLVHYEWAWTLMKKRIYTPLLMGKTCVYFIVYKIDNIVDFYCWFYLHEQVLVWFLNIYDTCICFRFKNKSGSEDGKDSPPPPPTHFYKLNGRSLN
jgi:hypothetical protein